jgi:hypothetical protein
MILPAQTVSGGIGGSAKLNRLFALVCQSSISEYVLETDQEEEEEEEEEEEADEEGEE